MVWKLFYISLSCKYVYAVYFRWFRHHQCPIWHQRISYGSCCSSFVPTAIIFLYLFKGIFCSMSIHQNCGEEFCSFFYLFKFLHTSVSNKRYNELQIGCEWICTMERKKKLGKKQIWYEVQENESIEDCLARMRKDGFMVIGRKEEPLFHIVDGEPAYLRQKIQFKGIPAQDIEWFWLKTEHFFSPNKKCSHFWIDDKTIPC